MKDQFDLESLGVKKLEMEEAASIVGGDKFMKDLGYAIGYAFSWFHQRLADADVSSVGHYDYR